MNLRILVGLKRLDHEPFEEDGEASAGATKCAALGDGLVLDHIGERGLCLGNESRLKLK